MPGLRVGLFGLASVALDGQLVKLKPLTTAVLIRLIVADGAPVTVDELFRDCWPPAELLIGDYRTQVQKRILEIRRVLDPKWSSESGEESQVLPTQRGRVTAYRLAVGRDATDVFQFIELVSRARRSPQEDKIGLLERATVLWAGQPLLDVADKPWAASLVRQLSSLRTAAEQELTRAYERAGRAHDALSTAEELAAKSPLDTDLASRVETLREQVRAGAGKRVVRQDYAGPDVAITVMTGDLFDQDDANLVIGFCDTFDTGTDKNIIISAESAQGLLLSRMYGGDKDHLDKELRAALARVPRESVESRSAKPRGKLTRYPIGTVATLHHATRRVFAVAYSRMGNDLVAQSSMAMLSASLDHLWDAVHLHGQLKPVAMPLIGSGLSRTHSSPADLLAMIAGSFVASSRARYACPELRVIVPPPAFDKTRAAEVLRAVRAQHPDFGLERDGNDGGGA
jgi:DNA-binding SARP family transcriptional activator